MPKSLSNFISRMVCDTLSNAFLKSVNATATTRPASTAFLHVSVRCVSNSSVKNPAGYAHCLSVTRLLALATYRTVNDNTRVISIEL